MSSLKEGSKVSILSRVLAWIFVLCGALVVGIATFETVLLHKKWPWGIGGTIILALGTLLYCPLFFYVAWKGRAPRWWASIEQVGNKGLGIPDRNRDSTHLRPLKRMAWISASFIFGICLFHFGNQRGLFEDESGWVAIIIFVLVWLSVVVLMWRYFRRNSAGVNNLERKVRKKDQV